MGEQCGRVLLDLTKHFSSLNFYHVNLLSPIFLNLNFSSYLIYHHSHTLKCLVESCNSLPPVLSPPPPLHPAVTFPPLQCSCDGCSAIPGLFTALQSCLSPASLYHCTALPCPLLSPPITAQICRTDSVSVCVVFVLCLCCVCVLTLYSNMFCSLDCPIGHSNTIILFVVIL